LLCETQLQFDRASCSYDVPRRPLPEATITHTQTRSTKALATFNRMDRLANLENGLTANSLWQIYRICIDGALDYRSPIWWSPNRQISLLDKIQSKASRRILGVFRTAPRAKSSLEAVPLHPSLRLNRLTSLHAKRVRNLPKNHRIARESRKTSIQTRRANIMIQKPTLIQIINQCQRQYSGFTKEESSYIS
jgi:hypothetical protein